MPAPTDPGLAGSIRLVTPTQGWIRATLGDALVVTHDGAHSWETVFAGATQERISQECPPPMTCRRSKIVSMAFCW